MARKISKKSKRRLMTFGVLSVFSIGYFCFTLIGYIYNYFSLQREEKVLKTELIDLKDKRDYLKIEMQKLNDPAYVVRYAKEKFLYSSDNEFVIKLNDHGKIVDVEEEKNNSIPIVITSLLLFSVLILNFHVRLRKKNG